MFWRRCASRWKTGASHHFARGGPSVSVAVHAAGSDPTPDGKMPGESRSSPREIQNPMGRISGPLLDRIDLHVEVPQVKFREIAGDRTGGDVSTIIASWPRARPA